MNKLIISDCHLNDDYLVFKKILFPYIKEIINNYNIDDVIFLGDVFDKSIVSNTSLLLFKQLMILLKDYNINILLGNHEFIDETHNIYDVLLLNNNIKIINQLKFDKKFIYLPYINKVEILHDNFNKINEYINKTHFDEYYIFSHNDFSLLYQFKNKFLDINDIFNIIQNKDKKIFLINGHNHVSLFKKIIENVYLLNLGSALNLTFKDTTLLNNFLYINDSESDLDKKILLLQNKSSIQYYTFNIKDIADLNDIYLKLDKDNYKYLYFKINSPNIQLNNSIKHKFYKEFNVLNIVINYDLNINNIINDKNNELSNDNTNIKDLYTILDDLNINVSEFLDNKSIEEFEKVEILYTLLDLMFTDLNLNDNNKEEILSIVNKYYLLINKEC